MVPLSKASIFALLTLQYVAAEDDKSSRSSTAKQKTTIWNVTPKKLIKRPKIVTVDDIINNRFNETHLYHNCKSLKKSSPIFFPKLAEHFITNMTLWGSDEILTDKFGDATLDQVEKEKKETRKPVPTPNIKIKNFLKMYKEKPLYAVANLENAPELLKEIYFPPFLMCGGFLNALEVAIMWFSSGGTQSVLHQDSNQDNLYCVFDGQKRFAMWPPKHGDKIESAEYGWLNMDELMSKMPENEVRKKYGNAYGAFAGRINVNDLSEKHKELWEKLDRVDIVAKKGDCLLLPAWWHHIVRASDKRSVSVNMWWDRRQKMVENDCESMQVNLFAPREVKGDTLPPLKAALDKELNKKVANGGIDFEAPEILKNSTNIFVREHPIYPISSCEWRYENLQGQNTRCRHSGFDGNIVKIAENHELGADADDLPNKVPGEDGGGRYGGTAKSEL